MLIINIAKLQRANCTSHSSGFTHESLPTALGRSCAYYSFQLKWKLTESETCPGSPRICTWPHMPSCRTCKETWVQVAAPPFLGFCHLGWILVYPLGPFILHPSFSHLYCSCFSYTVGTKSQWYKTEFPGCSKKTQLYDPGEKLHSPLWASVSSYRIDES